MNLPEFLERAGKAFLLCRVNPSATEQKLNELIEQLPDLSAAEIAALSLDRRRLLDVVRLVIPELERLRSSEQNHAVRSLGYAVHPLPELVRGDEPFDDTSFRFNYRIAAYHWSALSIDVRRALNGLVNLDDARAEALLARPGFPIDMFGKRR